MPIDVFSVNDLINKLANEEHRVYNKREQEILLEAHDARIAWDLQLWSDDSDMSKVIRTVIEHLGEILRLTIFQPQLPGLLSKEANKFMSDASEFIEHIERVGRTRCQAVEHWTGTNPAPEPDWEKTLPEQDLPPDEVWTRGVRDAS